jgi:hypothetical protein
MSELHFRGHPTGNGTNGKRQLPFVYCKRKTETKNFRLFAANGNRKWKFVFLGRQTKNSNGRLQGDIYRKILPPHVGGDYQPMSFGGKNIKIGREKRGKCKIKRKKGKRK